MAAKHPQTWDEDQLFIERTVSYWTQRLIGDLRLARWEREDLQQELLLHLIRRLSAFDPGRASRRTFISRIVANRFKSIIEERQALKRDTRKDARSLDSPAHRDRPDGHARVDLLSNDTYRRRLTDCDLTDEERRDMKIDIQILLGRMPARERAICRLLYRGEPASGIARQLKIHRS